MAWWKQVLGIERDGLETKDILPWRGVVVGTEHADNFVTNQVTVAQYSDALTRRNILGLSAVWACVNLLAGTIASLPLVIYRTDSQGVRRSAKDHPLDYVLRDSPNFDQSAVDFWEFMAASIELQGNAYAVVERRNAGEVFALRPVAPADMSVRRNDRGFLEYRRSGRLARVYDAKDILHIRGPLGDEISGLSTLATCAGAFEGALAADSAAATIFANAIRPSGILSTDPGISLSAEQRAEFEQLLTDKFRGALNAGRPMLLDRGMKWQQLDLSPEDAQMLETRGFGVEEVCRVFGVPPHMVGHSEKSTSWGSGIEQQTLGFVKFSLRRRLKRIEQALEKQLLTARDRAEGITIEFNLEGLLRGDSANRSAFYEKMVRMGVMTRNEVRALENLPPLPGGDELTVQMQDVPISQLGQQDNGDA